MCSGRMSSTKALSCSGSDSSGFLNGTTTFARVSKTHLPFTTTLFFVTLSFAQHLQLLGFAVEAVDEHVPANETLLHIHYRVDVIYLNFFQRKVQATTSTTIMLSNAACLAINSLFRSRVLKNFELGGPLPESSAKRRCDKCSISPLCPRATVSQCTTAVPTVHTGRGPQ